jgi:hypothetical protein
MGGLQCAKTIIDNSRELNEALKKRQAVVERALGCMNTSITLSATKSPARYPTEEMEAQFLACTANAKKAVDAALEPLLQMAADVAKYFEVTDTTGGSKT